MTNSINIQQIKTGLLLPVRAYPNARKNGITGIHDGQLKVQVPQAPEKGKANQAIIKLLAKLLDLKRSTITLYKGATSQQKIFHIADITTTELLQRIELLELQ